MKSQSVPATVLVHTRPHMDAEESARVLPTTGAVVGLCPTTGGKPRRWHLCRRGVPGQQRTLRHRLRQATSASIRLKSCASLSNSQRLQHRRRNVLCGGPNQSVGRALFTAALRGGRKPPANRPLNFAAGRRADLLVLDEGMPACLPHKDDTILDAAVFGPGRNLVRDVPVAGRWSSDRHHPQADGPALATAPSSNDSYRAGSMGGPLRPRSARTGRAREQSACSMRRRARLVFHATDGRGSLASSASVFSKCGSTLQNAARLVTSSDTWVRALAADGTLELLQASELRLGKYARHPRA